MIIYPAIDLKEGKCVRLYQGDMARDTVYNDNPAAQAHEFAASGFSWLHIVDLDGAMQGSPANREAVCGIIKNVDIPVQLGGGIRSLEHIEQWLSEGVSRVILGTAALRDPALVKEACGLFPDQVCVGIDAREGRVAVEGWVETSDMLAVDLALEFENAGVAALIYTDIERDGTGQGLNMEATIALASAINIPVIASGGVASLEDIRKVKEAEPKGVAGTIVGSALYDGTLNAQEILALASGDEIPLGREAANEA